MKFHKVDSNPNFFAIEEQISQYRKDNNTFERSITTKSEDNPYRFYDGPPFITGLPHYGSLLSSIAKDPVTRFWTQKGKRIDRVRGWDCHGIYVEQKVQDKLGLKSNLEIEAYGVDKFIQACYDYTSEISDQREWYVDHIGRWVDFDGAYKTMDNDYMESVMRVFKSLYDKNLVYKGKRVSLYSTKLNTPISNYEVALDNSYADISDPAITVKFKVKSSPESWRKDIEYTQDGFVKVAIAIIKKDGKILNLESKKHGARTFPGGKVDAGETYEQALVREITEELGVRIVAHKLVGGVKGIYLGAKMTNMQVFEVEVDGTPAIEETHEHLQLSYIDLQSSENEIGFELNIEGTIIDDPQEIITKFIDMYRYGLKLFGSTGVSTNQQTPATENEMKNNRAIVNDENVPVYLLAWTTTPWTIPANLALVVNKDIDYSQIYDITTQEYYIIAHNLIHKYYKDPSLYILVYTCKGSELVGLTYQPPFDYLASDNAADFQVYAADYVLDTDGTGIVHTAPEFGEDDFQTGKKFGLTQTELLDLEGKYTSQISDMTGVYYRDANDMINDKLKSAGLLFKKEQIVHSVAMCPRTNVPLIYKTQDSWFIDIQSIKPQLQEHNQAINRVPSHLKDGRFSKSMESAPDWCISRTRYWATPMPVWAPEEYLGGYHRIVANLVFPLSSDNQNITLGMKKRGFGSGKRNGFGGKVVEGEGIESGSVRELYEEANIAINDKDLVKMGVIHFVFPDKKEVMETHVFKTVYDGEFSETEEMSPKIFEIDQIPYDLMWEADQIWLKEYLEHGDSFEYKFYFDKDYKLVKGSKIDVDLSHGNLKVMGSREEIFQLDQTGSKILDKQELDDKIIYIDTDTGVEFDLHRPFIDKIWGIVDGVKYVRIPEVLDPWLESGSMPYAQVHYPFENKEKFEQSFPADYVAEYLGQVRCWFFFMHALGVMLFDSPAFTNVICTGVLAGNDGRKMSKSYGNYPDPKESMEKYGSDALRMYMANSPIMVGGDMNFMEEGWKEVLRKISLPLWNSYSFFMTYASIDGFEPDVQGLSDMIDYQLDNKLDQWLIARLTQLVSQVHDGFVAYDMVSASTPIYEFMDDLTNWYIRRSRRRFWKSESDSDKTQAYNTLYVTLVEVCKVLAPFMPFLSEHIYRELTGRESVHLDDWTEVE